MIPAFNEESTIARVIIATKKYVDKIIVVNDGSSDMTGEIAEELGAIVVTHDKNRGYGAALRTGFKEALKESTKIVVTLDADGQHDPSEIPRLIEPIIKGEADIVIGSRFVKGSKGKIPRYRKIGISMITRVLRKKTKLKIVDAQSGFRAYRYDIIPLIVPTETGMGASVEILDRASSNKLRITEVPVSVKYGPGTSSLNPLYHGIDVLSSILKFATIRHPIAFYGVPGLIFLGIGMGFFVWMLQIYSIEGRIVTNIALIALSGTLIGLLLLTTALILYTIVTIIREERT